MLLKPVSLEGLLSFCSIRPHLVLSLLSGLWENIVKSIKKEAAWAISNATSRGTHAKINYLVNQGCIKPLCDLLVYPDPRNVIVCLKGLKEYLKFREENEEQGYVGG